MAPVKGFTLTKGLVVCQVISAVELANVGKVLGGKFSEIGLFEIDDPLTKLLDKLLKLPLGRLD